MSEAIKNYEEKNLRIYNEYIKLIVYLENLLDKFPKGTPITNEITKVLFKGCESLISSIRVKDNRVRMRYLIELDISLKVMKVLARASYMKKYITSKNMGAWTRKLADISNMLGSWINVCQKQ